MIELPPEYLAEIGRQLATLSAFLGGFAIAFIGAVLAVDKLNTAAGWVAGSAAVAAAAFAVAVVASTMLAVVLHPAAPPYVRQAANLTMARLVSVLAFMLGMYSLLLSLGLSGRIRSRSLGWLTGSVAGLAALIMTWLLIGV